MDELVEWLGAQLDEDERIARAAGGDAWRRQEHASDTVAIYDSKGEPVVYDEGWPTEEQRAHIAAYDPARVLREIDAKRRVLRDLASAEVALRATEPGRGPHELMTGATNSWRAVVKVLAAVYADRPGYLAEWRP
ncbi:DUF6221 family protein [Streptomyces griseoviridis]|uniref:DUF6221 family protein n=1 Tax=Streptomyces griseoviridis TaxID=45398 RepID=UPI00340E930A